MHAFLLINTDPLEFAKKNKAKTLFFVLQKIEDTRELKKITKFSFNQKTAIVIKDIDEASDEALNALLKNLEEPNENLIYILTASNINSVLPTIISRCEIIKSPITKHQITNNIQITNFINSKLTQKFEIVGKIKEREEAINFVEDLIFTDDSFNNKENYLRTLLNLKLNGNVSLQLANLIVTMGSHG